MKLTNENYHSVEARKEYMGYSQFKRFLQCEKEALAYVNGEVEDKKTEALIFGSYIDAYFSNEFEEFTTKNSDELYNKKTGELKAAYKHTEKVIEKIESDKKFLKYVSGEHQVIMTGEIAGVKFKIKIDSLYRGKLIVDQKVMKDLKPVWIETESGNRKVNFVTAYRYDLEGAIYREIYRQNTGEELRFVLAVTTKEEYPINCLLEIDKEDLDNALEEVKRLAPRFDAIKRGEIAPDECGECAMCRKDKTVTGIFSFHTLDPK